ncbi:hypothetical protein PAPYR_3828 [Paratrimastix pyriformis]|uniref:Uncharacterized protein n=1 Tax=Paratrimastix pyriformis TaxID=342808 RepID=A0ABQ8UQX5_9EUKA|nr:hypothetical protein PAPYR_3828 [Paratrimastix pyriformis]
MDPQSTVGRRAGTGWVASAINTRVSLFCEWDSRTRVLNPTVEGPFPLPGGLRYVCCLLMPSAICSLAWGSALDNPTLMVGTIGGEAAQPTVHCLTLASILSGAGRFPLSFLAIRSFLLERDRVTRLCTFDPAGISSPRPPFLAEHLRHTTPLLACRSESGTGSSSSAWAPLNPFAEPREALPASHEDPQGVIYRGRARTTVWDVVWEAPNGGALSPGSSERERVFVIAASDGAHHLRLDNGRPHLIRVSPEDTLCARLMANQVVASGARDGHVRLVDLRLLRSSTPPPPDRMAVRLYDARQSREPLWTVRLPSISPGLPGRRIPMAELDGAILAGIPWANHAPGLVALDMLNGRPCATLGSGPVGCLAAREDPQVRWGPLEWVPSGESRPPPDPDPVLDWSQGSAIWAGTLDGNIARWSF